MNKFKHCQHNSTGMRDVLGRWRVSLWLALRSLYSSTEACSWSFFYHRFYYLIEFWFFFCIRMSIIINLYTDFEYFVTGIIISMMGMEENATGKCVCNIQENACYSGGIWSRTSCSNSAKYPWGAGDQDLLSVASEVCWIFTSFFSYSFCACMLYLHFHEAWGPLFFLFKYRVYVAPSSCCSETHYVN